MDGHRRRGGREPPALRILRRAATAIFLALLLPVPSPAHACPDDLRAALESDLAARDTSRIDAAVTQCPDRVYLVGVRMADDVLAGRGGAAGFAPLALLAARHAAGTGHPGLRDLVARYAAWDPERVARRAYADSIRDEAHVRYAHGRYEEADAGLRAAAVIYGEIGDPQRLGLVAATRAGVLAERGELDAARERAELGIRNAREVGFAAGVASGLFARGALEMREGELHAAIETFREVRRLGEILRADNYTSSALAMLANAYSLVGRHRDARAAHAEGLAVSSRLGAERTVIGELINLARIDAGDLAHWNDAEDELTEAIERSRSGGYPQLEAIARAALADLQHARGNTESALDSSARAIARLRELGDIENLANTLAARGRILREAGRIPEAREEIAAALEAASAGVSVHSLGETLAQSSFVATAASDPRTGLSRAYDASDRIEAARARLSASALRASFLDLRTHLHEAAIEAHRVLGATGGDDSHAREALRLADGLRSRTLRESLAQRGDPAGPASPETARERTALTEELSGLQLRLLEARAGGEESRRLGASIRRTRARIDSLEAASGWPSGGPGSEDGESSGLRAAESAEAMVAVSPGELGLEYFWGRETVYGWAVTRDTVRFFRVGAADDLEGLVRVYVATLRDPTRDPLESAIGRRLAGLLLGPATSLAAGVDRLVVVTDGPLLLFPFEALPDPYEAAAAGSRPNDARGTYLVQRIPIAYLPSLALGRHLETRARSRRSPDGAVELIAFGSPDLSGVASAGRWAKLPHSDLELRRLARLLSPRRTLFRTGRDASEAALRSAATRTAGVVHVAGHAHASAVDATASGLLLAAGDGTDGGADGRGGGDGFLTTREIAELDLSADLVVLTGCETGGGRIAGGEGVLGLSRAFFQAGASSVLATLWPIDDRASARFAESIYRHLLDGSSKGDALAKAMRDALARAAAEPDGGVGAGAAHGEGAPDLAIRESHPSHWAAFVLLGDSRGCPRLAPRSIWEQPESWPLFGIGLAAALATGATARRRRCR